MAVASPKISLHLYLNNPHGLLSAAIPDYTINSVDIDSRELARHPYPSIKRKSPQSSTPEITPREIIPLPSIPIPDVSEDEERPSPALGFTWSLNLEKRTKPLIQRKVTPRSLLEKLGATPRGVEPLGVIKLGRNDGPIKPSSYHIQRLRLNDKKQRKMSSKLSEWLDQYNDVSSRQQEYLKRIQDLRRGLEHKKEKNIIVSIDQMRMLQKGKIQRKYPLYTMSRMEESAVNQGPAPFPSRPCVTHVDDKPSAVPKIKMAPKLTPRKLAPIVKKVKTNKFNKITDTSFGSPITSPRNGFSKMTTEYEPFESIARRNKLNLTPFFNSSQSHRRIQGNARLPMNVSTVTIINETPEEDETVTASPVNYITDLSTRKSMSTNRSKDEKPG